MKENLKKLMNKLPYVRGLYQQNNHLKQKENTYNTNSCFSPGHFYSPIVDVEDIRLRENEIWENVKKDGIKGLDLRTAEQLHLLERLSVFYPALPFKPEKQENLRYYFENGFYTHTDGIILYSMMRHYKPKRILEVGSGFSSAVMLDTNGLFFDNQIQLTFIEPYPDRLYSLITNKDREAVTIYEKPVQSIPLQKFEELQAGDFLFVDSSHISKAGSDVNHIIFEILPVLKPGVLIHFHDVFYPFEYPKKWVLEGRNWNEDYLLKAFLMYNNDFEIKFFSEYIHKHHKEAFKNMPLSYEDPGGDLWIEKK